MSPSSREESLDADVAIVVLCIVLKEVRSLESTDEICEGRLSMMLVVKPGV